MPAAKKPPAKPAQAVSTDPADDPRALDRHIGSTVHGLRMQCRLTITDLARLSGLSPGMLSKIENGQVSASLDSLRTLARALGVGIAELMQDFESAAGEVQYVPKAGGLEVIRRGTKKGHTYHLLYSNRGPHKPFEPFLVTLTDESEVFPAFKHEGLEFLHILEGRIQYRHGNQIFMLGPGDSLTFDGKVPHGPEQLVKLPIVMLAVMVYTANA
ncbi:MAG: family transcriptional regulator [Betaproteobacteria bacterium]|nr:family transcriptional regulator [Betaproteobacteria bacterium]